MSTCRPLTVTWPCDTNWRAWRRVAASPRRVRTSSRRRSSKAPLEHAQQLALAARRAVEDPAELALAQSVVVLGPLLLAYLLSIIRQPAEAAAVLARRIRAPLEA
jgi:hypothetical protein